MKKLLIIIAMSCAMCAGLAQNVQRQGNTFVQVSNTKSSKPAQKTIYTYKAKDGKVYPIYLSARGKAFIIRVSKKTGKEYKQYLPEVTTHLNTAKK